MKRIQNLYGFYETTEFPYYKGGNVEFFNDEGEFAVEENPVSMFTPVLVVPLERGKEIEKELKALVFEQKFDIMNLENRYLSEIK